MWNEESGGVRPVQVQLLMLLRCVRQAVPVTPVLFNWYQEAGVGVRDVFIVTSASSALGVLFEIPSGWVADRFGRVRVLIISLTLLAGAFATLLLAPHALVWVWVSAVLKPLSSALFSGTDVALLHETVRELEERRAYNTAPTPLADRVQQKGLLQESRHVFAIIITEAACYILGSAVARWYGIYYVLLASVLPPLLGVALCGRMVEPVGSAQRQSPKSLRKAVASGVESIRECVDLFYPGAAGAGGKTDADDGYASGGGGGPRTSNITWQLYRLSILSSLTYFTLWLNPILWEKNAFHVSANGLLSSLISVVAAGGSLLCPTVMTYAAQNEAVVISGLCLLVALCFAMFAGSALWVVTGNLLLGVARGVMWPLSVSIVNRLVGDRNDIRSGALSFYAALMKVVQIVAGPPLGHALERYGPGACCVAIAGCVALLSLCTPSLLARGAPAAPATTNPVRRLSSDGGTPPAHDPPPPAMAAVTKRHVAV